jgi:hypothetical protein
MEGTYSVGFFESDNIDNWETPVETKITLQQTSIRVSPYRIEFHLWFMTTY